MITEAQAQQFAKDWIDAWNAHDLERIMSHYDENVTYYSPFVTKLNNKQTGVLYGKESVIEYAAIGLQTYPELHFELERVFIGVTSVTLLYQIVDNLLAAEVFELNEKGLVSRVQCHYTRFGSSCEKK